MIISVENNLDQLPQTLFSFTGSNLTAGGTAISIKNTNSFTNQYAVQIGKTGEEQSEIRIINTPSGTILPLNTSTLVYDHPLDTPVYLTHYDKIIFKRSTVGTAGTATAISSGTISITPDSLYTIFNDASGVATYAYKTQLYNSVSGDLSSESDWVIPGGPTFYSLQKLRKRSKDALYDATYLKSDDIVDDWINEWGEEMTNAAIKVNKGYSIGTAQYTYGTAGYGTITEGGFKQADKIEITYDGLTFLPSTEIPLSEYSETDIFSSLAPRHSWEGETVFRILPFGAVGTARFSFGKFNTPLVNDSDELPQSLRSYTTGCVEYVLYRAYDNDSKDTQADKHYNRFLKKVTDFTNEMTPRDQTSPKTINLVEELSGNDDLLVSGEYYQ